MKNVQIRIICHGKDFSTSFRTSKPEYMIADEAYCLALTFAKTRALAEYGHPIPAHQFSIYLEGLDYDYIITEEEN